MKFGIFLPNGKNGYILSKASPQYMPTYEHNKQIAIEAERQGFDMVLSMMKYRGFGGETGYWDACLESFTLMAALAAVTSKLELFPSVTIPAHHPAVIARMVATIDDISNGRCGLNIVTGWNKAEYEQMGLWRGDKYYQQRYDYAHEYLKVMQMLWENGRATYQGENFQLKDCESFPMPKHRITVVCAGQSPAGAKFVAECADRNFVQAGSERLKEITQTIREAGEKRGRQVGTYAVFHVISADTDREAEDKTNRIMAEADEGAIKNMIASAKMDTNPKGISEYQTTGMTRSAEDGHSAFMTIPAIYGSHATVAEKLDRIIETTGIDGMLFSFPDFVSGVRAFGEEIRPRMKFA
ncbi:MAG: hypothetical protein BGP06_19820 [Rhizobiales bacterium 65-9]|jgi:pyrimidine oxygenase|nr:LLM class flavin-dependent oxidoreductase [Hyphomicrobiales bacterium]OJY37097.1 MAG: hypothetical protein BGP06_19820 [Rhizobiales bacterium 65-9]